MLQPGDFAPHFEVQDVLGEFIRLQDFASKKLLLMFHRYAACPFCNLRTEQINQYAPLWQSKGLGMIAFFQSSTTSILKHIGNRPPLYPVIGDPERVIYKQYYVESDSKKAAATLPRKTIAGVRAHLQNKIKVTDTGDEALIPAEFLINPDLTIHTAYYGNNIADHLPIKQIIEFIHS